MTDTLKASEIKPNPDNPRVIKDDKFKKLVRSLRVLPIMLRKRPILIDEDNMIIGGNMRHKAALEAGMKELPIERFTREDAIENNKIAKVLDPDYIDKTYEEQRDEMIIKDNVSGGEWDWDILANDWDAELLDESGLDVIAKVDENKEWSDIDDFDVAENSLKIVIQFETESQRTDFENEFDIKIRTKGKNTWSTWWPYKERNDFSDTKIQ